MPYIVVFKYKYKEEGKGGCVGEEEEEEEEEGGCAEEGECACNFFCLYISMGE